MTHFRTASIPGFNIRSCLPWYRLTLSVRQRVASWEGFALPSHIRKTTFFVRQVTAGACFFVYIVKLPHIRWNLLR
jgi:hypothetical protein